jgi:DNA-binding YbaB/EbfC family protein
MDIIKNLQNLQSKMGEAQEKLKTLRAVGSSGGDLVMVTIDGTMEVVNLRIDPVAVDPRDVKMLEELVGAAFTDAVRKMREVLQREMTQLAGGLDLPGGFPGGE